MTRECFVVLFITTIFRSQNFYNSTIHILAYMVFVLEFSYFVPLFIVPAHNFFKGNFSTKTLAEDC